MPTTASKLARFQAQLQSQHLAVDRPTIPPLSLAASWGFRRRQLSLWGNRLARWIASLRGVRDGTAGFKAIRATALRAAKVQEISVLGYAFQVALLQRLLHAGARVVEEPIYFRDRERGVTKLGLESLVAAPDHPSDLHQILPDGAQLGSAGCS